MLTVQRLFVVVFVAAVVALSLNAKGESDMATLNDLVGQIDNAALRERIEEEIKRVVKQKKFGLVFEEHLPECTPLWEIPVKRGSLVAKKDGKMDDVWRVAKVKDGKAICVRNNQLVAFASRTMPFSVLGTGIKRALERQPNIEFYNDFDGDQFKVVIPRLTSKE